MYQIPAKHGILSRIRDKAMLFLKPHGKKNKEQCVAFHRFIHDNYWQTYGMWKEETGGFYRKRWISGSPFIDPTLFTLDELWDEFTKLT